jgi:hypothetical protein
MGLGNRFLRRVVKNDAMKIGKCRRETPLEWRVIRSVLTQSPDPPEIYNPRVFVLALCSCFGGTLYVSFAFRPRYVFNGQANV